MTAIYRTDEEILTAACVIPANMFSLSGRVPQEYEQMIKAVREDGIDLCMVVWLDDTIAFLTYESSGKLPRASLIIDAYRGHHKLPPQMPATGGVQ